MKKIFLFILTIFTFSCDSEDAGDCLQTAGKTTQETIDVDPFSTITIHRRIALVIEEGPIQKVVVETGENLQPEIDVQVIDNELVIRNFNECNFFRDYGVTTVHVTTPTLTSIRNASELNVESEGVLTFPELYLRSSGEKNEYLAVGDWHLNIDNQKIRIWSNGIANFYMQGKTDVLDLNFSDGDTRFEGKELHAKKVKVRNVSSNDMLVYPIDELTGSIHSTGDVISFNRPPVVNVDVQSSFADLIFK